MPTDDLSEPEQTHTAVKGDTLSHIATLYFGNAGLWPRIFEANRDVLDDPDRIPPGLVLKIPAVGPHSGTGLVRPPNGAHP
jgi:nucleoid-associated protein YgaU